VKVHVGRRMFFVAAVLAALAVFVAAFFVFLTVRSVVAGPGSAPAQAPPNPGHSYDQVELPAETWSGLDADKVDGMHAGQSGTNYIPYADASGNVGIGTAAPGTTLQVGSELAVRSDGAYPKLSISGGGSSALTLASISAGDPYWFNDMALMSDEATDKTWQIGHLNTGYGNPINSFGWMYHNGSAWTPNNPKMALSPDAGLSLGDNYGKVGGPPDGLIVEGNVGIGTTSPGAKVQVAGGDAYIETQGKGLILRATNGSNCYRVTVNNAGTLSTALVSCP